MKKQQMEILETPRQLRVRINGEAVFGEMETTVSVHNVRIKAAALDENGRTCTDISRLKYFDSTDSNFNIEYGNLQTRLRLYEASLTTAIGEIPYYTH